MSHKIVREVLEHSRSKGAARLVFIVLADRAQSDRKAFPKRDLVAREANVSESTVTDAMEELERLGEIRYEGRRGGKGGGPKMYHLDARPLHIRLGQDPQPTLLDSVEDPTEEVPKPDQSQDPTGRVSGPNWSGLGTGVCSERSLNEEEEEARARLDAVVEVLRQRSWNVSDVEVEIVAQRCRDAGLDPIDVAKDTLIRVSGTEYGNAAWSYQKAFEAADARRRRGAALRSSIESPGPARRAAASDRDARRHAMNEQLLAQAQGGTTT